METYLDCLENLFSAQKERTFTDRTEIMSLLNDALIRLNEDSEFYQVFSIHGMGGIGKTRLVNEFTKFVYPEPVHFISFEIERRSEVVNNLYQIRKVIDFSCPFFDFALLRYWELTNPAALNDSFMKLFKKDFFVSMLDAACDSIGGSISLSGAGILLPQLITPSSILEFVNYLYLKIPELRHNELFKIISSTSTTELLNKLPALLGIEINHLVSCGKIQTPVFIFDSYQESQPYSKSEEWLYDLIKEAGRGLYIVTSREPLHWSESNEYLVMHNLQCYPEDEARILLEETIKNRPDLVEQIIDSTQCVPIYVDLALNVYESEKINIGEFLVEKALFCDRHKLVQHFINHMKPSWQSVVLDLATIRIFNKDIFEHLIKCKMLDCSPYEYKAIIQSNLFCYVSESKSSSLIKLHDVFCMDAQNGRPVFECYSIYKTYLDYICYRRDVLVTDNNGATLAALFLNAVSLAITIEERLSLEETQPSEQSIETNVVEQLLDVFFTLVAYKIRFIPLPYENIKTEVMKKVCQFVYIKAKEKENTLKTIEELEQIGDISCFGKHKLSYEAVLFYTKSLAGDYDALETWINQVEYQLDEHAKCEWFYNRIKLYQADCYMLNGKFQSAYSALVLLGNEYISMEDYYSIQRTIGHIQRFNFQLDEAEKTYNSLMRRYHNNPVFREYLVANLAETQCYFPDSNFIKRNKKILKSMVTPYNIKNKGKVLYALAIANTVKKHYHTARACIDECIKINCEDGYQSGELFAYIAQAYLDYALDGVVSTQTDNQIEHLLTCNKVYTFFRLQLALMRGDCSNVVKIGRTYDWLDYSQTERVCRLFLSQLRNA